MDKVHVSEINRSRSLREALEATGRRLYVDDGVATTMPCLEEREVTRWIFELDYDPTHAQLDAEYKLRGLKADPLGLAKVLEDYSTFDDERPVVCQWDLGEDGLSSFMLFAHHGHEQRVIVERHDFRFSRFCRFAGVRT